MSSTLVTWLESLRVASVPSSAGATTLHVTGLSDSTVEKSQGMRLLRWQFTSSGANIPKEKFLPILLKLGLRGPSPA